MWVVSGYVNEKFSVNKWTYCSFLADISGTIVTCFDVAISWFWVELSWIKMVQIICVRSWSLLDLERFLSRKFISWVRQWKLQVRVHFSIHHIEHKCRWYHKPRTCSVSQNLCVKLPSSIDNTDTHNYTWYTTADHRLINSNNLSLNIKTYH